MSIYRRLTSKCGELYYVKDSIEYVFDMLKTEEDLCHTRGASKENAYKDMVFIKQLYRKVDKRQCLHWILSYEEEVKDIAVVDNIGEEVLDLIYRYYGAQAIMATHINTEHLHNHFVINSVRYDNGAKFSDSIQDMANFKREINKILKKNNMPLIKMYDTCYLEDYDDGDLLSNVHKKKDRSMVFNTNKEIQLLNDSDFIVEDEEPMLESLDDVCHVFDDLDSLNISYERNYENNNYFIEKGENNTSKKFYIEPIKFYDAEKKYIIEPIKMYKGDEWKKDAIYFIDEEGKKIKQSEWNK